MRRRPCIVCGRISDQARCPSHQLTPRDQARARGNLREAVIHRDRGICQICGQPVPHGTGHVDHITPRADGGSTEPTNLRLTHARCNLRKGAA